MKLVDLYNTKYFYAPLVLDLNYLFTTIQRLQDGEDYAANRANELLGSVYDAAKNGEDIEIDLAGAKFTSDTNLKITLAQYNGIHFVDSENQHRDVILRENKRRFAIKLENTQPLPLVTYNTHIPEYIRLLDKDVVYDVSSNNEEIMVPLCTLIQIFRPSVKLHIDKIVKSLLTFIASKFDTEQLLQYNEFYMITNEGVQVVQGHTIYLQSKGEVSITQVLRSVRLVPTVFGSQVLKDDPVFMCIAEECVNMLNKYKNTRPRTLREVLSQGGNI